MPQCGGGIHSTECGLLMIVMSRYVLVVVFGEMDHVVVCLIVTTAYNHSCTGFSWKVGQLERFVSFRHIA